jgi:hypothetical protein
MVMRCRQAADRQLKGLGLSPVADQLSLAAVRLMYIRAAADPSSLTFSTPGKPGWLLVLQQSVKVLANLHTMQLLHGIAQDCHPVHCDLSNLANDARSPPACAGRAMLEMSWRAASAAELQMCLAGLLEFCDLLYGLRAMTVAALYACMTALEAAASEYACSAWAQAPCSAAGAAAAATSVATRLDMIHLSSPPDVSEHPAVLLTPLQQQTQVRHAVHQETRRVVRWGLWLLGVA